MLSFEDIQSLTAEAWPCVSIYVPAEGGLAAGATGAIRLKNLLDEAARSLLARGVDRRGAEPVLAPVRPLADRPDAWPKRASGLALFLSPEGSRTVQLPQPPPELVAIGRHFHVKPLLPFLEGDGRFHLLALTARRARLLRGGRYWIQPLAAALPDGVAAVSGESDYQNTLQYNPIARPHDRGAAGVVKSHNFGEAPEELRKAQLIEYVRRVAAGVQEALKDETAPLVLAAEDELRGHYRKLNRCQQLLAEDLDLNPDALDGRALHDRAWPLVAPLFAAERERAAAQVRARLGTAEPDVAIKLDEIIAAARFGRVADLLVAADDALWGRFDEGHNAVLAHGTPTEDDEDLLNYAAIMTLTHGGRVFARPRAELPRQALAAAALRY